jgi:serine/threonine protein kinase
VANFGDRYQLIGRLGSGGMGEVWLAHDEQLAGRPVAIKILHQHMLPNAGDVARFEREMRLAAMMDHPNIVTVYTTGTHDGAPFMVMEYLRGQDLEKALPGEDDAGRVAGIGRDICSALAYAHRQGVIHRDIKPGNLFLCESGLVKVTDFGVAKAVGGVTASTADSLPGTVAYLPPERWRGDPPSFSNDIWAAGCVLYQLISGRLPRVLPDAAGYAGAAIRGDPIPDLRDISEAPAWLAGPVMAMLAPDPDSRPTAGDCVRLLSDEQLPASVSGQRHLPGPPGPGESKLSLVTGRATAEPVAASVTQPTAARAAAGRSRRLNRMVFAIGGVALLLLAGSVTAWLLTAPAGVSKLGVQGSPTSAPSSRAAAAETVAASASVRRSASAAAPLPSSASPAGPRSASPAGSGSASPAGSRSASPASSRSEPPAGTSTAGPPVTASAAGAPSMVPVPDVVGMSFVKARKLLESDGFTVAGAHGHNGQAVTSMSPSGEAPPGSVITLVYG